jgi:hypothetical protein
MFGTEPHIVLMCAGATNGAQTARAEGAKKLIQLLFAMACHLLLSGYYILTNKFMQSLTSFVITLYFSHIFRNLSR